MFFCRAVPRLRAKAITALASLCSAAQALGEKLESRVPRLKRRLTKFRPDGRLTGSYPETLFEEVGQTGTGKAACGS